MPDAPEVVDDGLSALEDPRSPGRTELSRAVARRKLPLTGVAERVAAAVTRSGAGQGRRFGRRASACVRSGAVELEEVVGGGDELPLRARGAQAASERPGDPA
jgi:hypothetical protein